MHHRQPFFYQIRTFLRALAFLTGELCVMSLTGDPEQLRFVGEHDDEQLRRRTGEATFLDPPPHCKRCGTEGILLPIRSSLRISSSSIRSCRCRAFIGSRGSCLLLAHRAFWLSGITSATGSSGGGDVARLNGSSTLGSVTPRGLLASTGLFPVSQHGELMPGDNAPRGVGGK